MRRPRRSLRRSRAVSFDHLVGAGEERWRDREAEGFSGLEVDDELDFGGLHDRQLGRLLAFQNTPNIDADLPRELGEIAAVAHQAASGRERAKDKDRRQRVAHCQRSKALRQTDEEAISRDYEPPDLQGGELRKDGIEVALALGVQNVQVQS